MEMGCIDAGVARGLREQFTTLGRLDFLLRLLLRKLLSCLGIFPLLHRCYLLLQVSVCLLHRLSLVWSELVTDWSLVLEHLDQSFALVLEHFILDVYLRSNDFFVLSMEP